MKIILREDPDMETVLCCDFLHSEDFPQHRNIIYAAFPELRIAIDASAGQEKRAVSRFLQAVREAHRSNIAKATAFIKAELEKKGEKVLEILSRLMGTHVGEYALVPTILPFSPFRGNEFFYSIHGSLRGKTDYPKVLAVAVHEISHILLLGILNDRHIALSGRLLYFIKEIVAPILVFQDEFDGLFPKEFVGNFDVSEIYVEDRGRTVRAFDYFLRLFDTAKRNGGGFDSFLADMVRICRQIESGIAEKGMYWDTYGMGISKDQALLAEFQKPIPLPD